MIRRQPTDRDAGFNLRINELVIDGYAPAESRAIAAALEQELGRLLADGVPPFAERSGAAFDRLDAGTVTLAPGAAPAAVGRSAARAVVQRLRAASAGRETAPPQRGGP
jgi:hypothetical protein